MKRFNEIIQRFSKTSLAVIGDMAADIYIYGKPYRLSREAPVIVVRHDYQKVIPGGAANTVNNLIQLGAQVYPVGMLGNDDAGIEVYNYFKEYCTDTRGLLLSSTVDTITKTRIMAGDDHTSKQQVIRIDKESKISLSVDEEKKILEHLSRIAPSLDSIVVSDYGYGFVTKKLLSLIKDFSTEKPVIVDSRYRMGDFRGVTIVTPNQSEAEAYTGMMIKDDKSLAATGKKLLKMLQARAVLITQGNQGMSLFEKDKNPVHIPIIGEDEITDVTGAGDTVAAVIGLALGAGASFIDAACLSNYAASVVVMKRGTATIVPEELTNAIKSKVS